MGILIKKEGGVHIFTGLGRLAIISFIVSIASAFISTIWAVYLDSLLHNIAYVGYLSATLTLVSFLSYFFIIPVIEKSSKSKIYALSLLLVGFTYVLFAISTKFYFTIILAFL